MEILRLLKQNANILSSGNLVKNTINDQYIHMYITWVIPYGLSGQSRLIDGSLIITKTIARNIRITITITCFISIACQRQTIVSEQSLFVEFDKINNIVYIFDKAQYLCKFAHNIYILLAYNGGQALVCPYLIAQGGRDMGLLSKLIIIKIVKQYYIANS